MIYFPKDICVHLCVCINARVCTRACMYVHTHICMRWRQGLRERCLLSYPVFFHIKMTLKKKTISSTKTFSYLLSQNGPSTTPGLLSNSLPLPPSLIVFLFLSMLRRSGKWWALSPIQSPLPSGRAVEGYPLKAVCAQQAVKVMLHS